MLFPALLNLPPLVSVSAVSFQQVPQAGPGPAPGPTPNSFCDTAATKPVLPLMVPVVMKPQATLWTWQFPEPQVSVEP